MSPRNEKGQFLETTGNSTYKNVLYDGNRMGEHNRSMCIALGISKIPNGLIVHHIDKNKKNNDIDNLSLMTVTAHNRLHAHPAWNKGITAKDNVDWNEAIKKAVKSRKGSYVSGKCKECYDLRMSGMSFVEIGNKLNITRETASHRVRAYLNYKKTIDPLEKSRIEKYEKIRNLKHDKSMKWSEIGKELNENHHNIRRFYNSFTKSKYNL